jgi:predicted enzyme related to lactoylglutathione lyase
MPNQIVWCDIPVLDLNRAIRFYSAVLGAEVKRHDMPGMSIGVFPDSDNAASGCLFTSNDEKPCDKGLLLYLNCSGRLDDAIAGVEPNGGKILKPKHQIGPYGFRAIVLDSEGNRVALHSN